MVSKSNPGDEKKVRTARERALVAYMYVYFTTKKTIEKNGRVVEES